MDQLKELVIIVSKQKIKNLDILTNQSKGSKLFELYDGVQSGRFNTDEEAVLELYEGNSSFGTYKKLKGRLIRQLINTVLFVSSTPDLNDHLRLFYDCHKFATAVEILMGRGARKSAVILAKKTLKQSIRLETTHITLLLLNHLRKYYAYDGQLKKFEEYNNLLKYYKQIRDAEMLAMEYIEHLSALIARSSATEKLIPFAKAYEKELKNLYRKIDSALFYKSSYSVYVNRCEFEGDYIGLQRNCQEAIRYLESREFVRNSFVFFFLFKSLNTYLRFKQFEEGRETILKCLQLLTVSTSRNWFLIQEQYILLCFHCTKYEEGYSQFCEVMSNRALKKIPEGEREKWHMYTGYFEWFKRTDHLIIDSEKKDVLPFKPSKFVNMVPVYAKDKEGFNAAILILQVLFLIQMRNYDGVIDREEGLKMYAYRYLRKKQSYRTHCFVKMLLVLPNSYFNRIAVMRKAATWYNKLLAKPVSDSVEAGTVEIVPYEDLWEIVLEQLDEGFHKPRKNAKTKTK